MENYQNWLLEEKTSLLNLVRNTFFEKQVNTWDENVFEINFQRISLAFDIATKCHEDEFRDSGEPYFTHPLSVARILLEQFQDVHMNQILLALVHDTIESKPHFQEIIDINLWPESVKNILALSKKDVKEYLDASNEPQKYLYYSQEIFSQDIPKYAPGIIVSDYDKEMALRGRFLLQWFLKERRDHDFFSSLHLLDQDELYVKIADRLDNLKTIHACAPEKQARTIEGTIKYFLPVAELACPNGYDLLIEALILVTKERNRWKVRDICNWWHNF